MFLGWRTDCHTYDASSSIPAGNKLTFVNLDVTVHSSVARSTVTLILICCSVGTSGTVLTRGLVSTHIIIVLTEATRVALVTDALTRDSAGACLCVSVCVSVCVCVCERVSVCVCVCVCVWQGKMCGVQKLFFFCPKLTL